MYNTTEAQTLAMAAVSNMPLTSNPNFINFPSSSNIRTSFTYNSVQIGVLHIPTAASYNLVIYILQREKQRRQSAHPCLNPLDNSNGSLCPAPTFTSQLKLVQAALFHNSGDPPLYSHFLQAHPQLSSISSIIGLPKINSWQTYHLLSLLWSIGHLWVRVSCKV